MKRKDIIKKYIQEVSLLFKSGRSITDSVKQALSGGNIEYTDSLRRGFSKALHKLGENGKRLRLEDSNEYKEALERILRQSRYYLITWAQAETSIHENFWKRLNDYASFLGAEIIVQAGRYKNPNSLESSKNIKEREKNKSIWDSRLRDYLYASRLTLCEGLQVLCDVKVMPTAALPLSDLDGFTGTNSTILPHPKVHLKSLPILEGYNHKLSLSTGAVTLSNYTDTKAGKKGEFHHQIGFAIVEIDSDGKFHIRQVQADDDGNFYDLFYKIDENGVHDLRDKDISGYDIVFGDLHVANRCEESLKTAIDISKILKAENIVLHDLFDGESVNHHEEKDPFKLLQKEESGKDNLIVEIQEMIDVVKHLKNELPNAIFHNIASNHNDFLDRWLRDTDWRKTRNKKAYLQFASIVAEGKAKEGVINYILNKEVPEVKTYPYGGSLIIKNIENALHGDKGANGSRGSVNQFKNLPFKSTSAHGHCPIRIDGSLQVGTLTKLRLGYNNSLSNWMNGVVVTYPNGQRSHIHIINGKYTTL